MDRQSDDALVELTNAIGDCCDELHVSQVNLLARAILPIIETQLAAAKADAGVLHIGTMKVWRGHTPGTIFIQQDSGEGGEFPEADLEALWQSYYAENF